MVPTILVSDRRPCRALAVGGLRCLLDWVDSVRVSLLLNVGADVD